MVHISLGDHVKIRSLESLECCLGVGVSDKHQVKSQLLGAKLKRLLGRAHTL